MNVTKARQHMKVRRDRFIVGYVGALNIVFGKRTLAGDSGDRPVYCEPMTLLQAQRTLAKMPCKGCAIFQLVPVEVNG